MDTDLDHSLLVHKNVGAGDVTVDEIVGFKETDSTAKLRS